MKQTVEEAARIYRKRESPNDGYSVGIKEIEERREKDFVAGAEWQAKQSPWISVEETLPPIGVDVIHTDIDTGRMYYGKVNKVGVLILGTTPFGETTVTHYMIVPKFPFDEILEANKNEISR